jgi:nicotinate-nucleotide adenylyltransferase
LAGLTLGVFGGTFNPIHRGHLHIARCILRLFRLSQVHFVVASEPPHKPGLDIEPFFNRYAMVSLATAEDRRFVPSPVELERPSSPFSVHTMRKLVRRTGIDPVLLYFIAGGDSLLEVGSWYRSEELLSSYNFVFVMRPGFPLGEPGSALPAVVRGRVCDLRGVTPAAIRKRLRIERDSRKLAIFVLDVDAPDISASEIRLRASSGRAIGRLVPPRVHEYILKLRLYGER